MGDFIDIANLAVNYTNMQRIADLQTRIASANSKIALADARREVDSLTLDMVVDRLAIAQERLREDDALTALISLVMTRRIHRQVLQGDLYVSGETKLRMIEIQDRVDDLMKSILTSKVRKQEIAAQIHQILSATSKSVPARIRKLETETSRHLDVLNADSDIKESIAKNIRKEIPDLQALTDQTANALDVVSDWFSSTFQSLLYKQATVWESLLLDCCQSASFSPNHLSVWENRLAVVQSRIDTASQLTKRRLLHQQESILDQDAFAAIAKMISSSILKTVVAGKSFFRWSNSKGIPSLISSSRTYTSTLDLPLRKAAGDDVFMLWFYRILIVSGVIAICVLLIVS